MDGVWGLGKPVKMGKLVAKIFLDMLLNEFLKTCQQIIFADEKADVK